MQRTDLIRAGDGERNWREIVSRLLRIAVFIHMVGLTYALYTRAGSSIGGVALMDWGVTHATIAFHEKLWSLVLLLMATVLLFKPVALLPFFISAAIFADTAAAYRFGGAPFVEWVYFTNALRYALPLALGIFLMSEKPWSARATSWLLRIALAVVFAFHGLEAIQQHPRFIDFLIGSASKLTGLRISESAAVFLLKIIGGVDLFVAALLLVKRWPALLAWLCFWSLLTALSRITTYGFMSFPETLIRSSHIIAPLAIYALSRWEGNAAIVEKTAPADGKAGCVYSIGSPAQ